MNAVLDWFFALPCTALVALSVLLAALIATAGFTLYFFTLSALSGAGETNDGEIEPPAHPSAPASTRPDQEAAL